MIKLPNANQLAFSIGKLTRRSVEATLLAKPAAVKLPYGGTFHGGDKTMIAMCAADLAFAAYTGAALAMIPADAAEERIKAGALDQDLEENFAEVLNVLTRVFIVPDTHRVALIGAISPPNALPATIEGAAAASVKRADFELDLDGYGRGYLTLWGAA